MADLSIQQINAGKGTNTTHWWSHQKMLAIKDKKKKRKDAFNYTLLEGKVVTEKAGSFKNLNNVSKFKSLIKEGPYFICVICHRGLYKRSVISFPGVAVVHLQNSF